MSNVTQWLGIAILLAFSLGLSLFMRLDFSRGAKRSLPPNLGNWEPCPEAPEGESEGILEERRWIVIEGGLFRKHQLVEQRRTRRLHDGEILRVAPQKVVERWYSW